MRIGLLGGTFDPIHLGHLRAAENAREALALESVYLVPAHVPTHRGEPLSSPLDRYTMVALASAGTAAFIPSDVEIRREGPTYTVETVLGFAALVPGAEIVLVVGADTYPEMPTWRDARQLFARCRVAVAPRRGMAAVTIAPPFCDALGVEILAGPALEVSATQIRSRVREGASIRFLVPDAVVDYIAKRGLYQ